MTTRRTFLIGTGALLFGTPVAAQAQPASKIWRIGYLSPTIRNSEESSWLSGFSDAMSKLGYSENTKLTLDQRYAEDRLDRLPALATELVNLRPAVILTFATPSTLAAKSATATVPIVMVAVGDPLGVGIVKSLNKPGGNITGLALNNVETAEKRLQFLKEAVPKLSRVTVLANQKNPLFNALHIAQTRKVAERMDIAVEVIELADPERLSDAFVAMTTRHAGGVLVLPDPGFIAHRERIAQLALQYRLPSAAQDHQIAAAGCLLAYGADVGGIYRQAARFVDKILKGAKPGDIPVEQPTKFLLAINLKTAKALGLTIPQSLLLRADEVIQ
jgi:putative ABC transport system substrate-binding protein